VEAKLIGKMEQDQQPTEDYKDIIVETVATGFHKNSMYHQNSLFFIRED
jgi:hypothetical protein